MSKLGAYRAAERRQQQAAAEVPQADPHEPAWGILARREGGGIVVEVVEVDRRAVRVIDRRPAEAIVLAADQVAMWIAEKFAR